MKGDLERHCCDATSYLPLGGFTEVKPDMVMMIYFIKKIEKSGGNSYHFQPQEWETSDGKHRQ